MNWYFPINDGGEFHGIGDSGIDLFKGEPVKSLTREICQNSIDAGVNAKVPVKVEFQLFDLPVRRIPGYEQLKKNFQLAQKFCKQQNFGKAQTYFDKSLPMFEGQYISVLRISDFNTTGLPGAKSAGNNYTSPWFRLVRSVGSSDKADGSIGAFGSGKKAAFACSDLQTVFYATYVEGEGVAYQGVTKLIGFEDDEKIAHSDIGYYCEQKSMPILEEFILDDRFKRTVPGTDVYILSFKFGAQEWKKELISAVLDGFFYAIKENHLVVEVDSISIDSDTIGKLMEEYKEDVDAKTHDYYKLMTSNNTTRRCYSCMEENDVEIQMLVEPNLHKRAAIIRFPGMKVFDKGQISTTIPFAGICVIRGKEIAKLLGGLENIQHNKWELSRYDEDPAKRKKAEKQRDTIYRYIRELFTELRGQDTEGEVDPGIGDCLPDPMSENEEKREAITDEVLEIGKVKEIPVKPSGETDFGDENRDDVEDGDNQQGSSGGDREFPEHDPGPGPGPEPGPAPGSNPGPNPPFIDDKGNATPIKPVKANIIYKETDYAAGRYRIWITPQRDLIEGIIEIYMGAESEAYKAELKEATTSGTVLKTENHKIENVTIEKGKEIGIDIQMNYSDICSLEVKVYGH